MNPKPYPFLHHVLSSKLMIQFLFFACGAIALAQTGVPDGARIIDVRTLGSGCDQERTSVVLSPDLKDLSVFFDNYVVEIGTGSSHEGLLKLNKDCQIQVQLQVPDGWQMAFKGVDYRGFVNLSGQGTAFHRFSILQSGAPIVSMREASLRGPINDDYHVRSEVRPERVTWSPCLTGTTQVNLLSQIGVSLNPRSSDRSLTQITLDSADTSFKQTLSIDWRRCSRASEIPPIIRKIIRPDRPFLSDRR